MISRAFRVAPPLIMVLVLFGAIFYTSSCKKKECPSEAIITVVDSAGKPLVGATVVLDYDRTQTPTGSLAPYLPDKKTTDGSGKSYHSFKHEALLFIEVTKPPSAVIAKSYIKLEKCETVEKKIIFQ